MSNIWTGFLAVGIQLAAAAMGYQYLSHRQEGACRWKELRRLRPDPGAGIAMGVGLLCALGVFFFCAVRQEDSYMRALMNALVTVWLVTLGYVDLREKIIPNGMILVGLGGWLILMLLEIFLGGTPWKQLLMFSGLGGLVCGGTLLIIALVMRSGLGMGDVKLFFVLGLLYGLMDTYGIFLFTVIPMGLFAIGLLVLKKADRKATIPMAPFVVLGFLLSILAGM